MLQNIFLWYVQFEDAEVAMPIVITHSGLLEIHSDSSCKALRVSTPEASLLALRPCIIFLCLFCHGMLFVVINLRVLSSFCN